MSRPRPVLIVTTDLGQDPDDQQSLVRLLHFVNDFTFSCAPTLFLKTGGGISIRPISESSCGWIRAAYKR
ncbi:MAG: nucleoside hydrolase-like domain-containing protein [Bacteroidota bacterium]